jgi:L-2,4-diaminobutyrate decarboxylase
MYKEDFFSQEPESLEAYRTTINSTLEAMLAALPPRPYVGGTPAEVAAKVGTTICPPEGKPLEEVLKNFQEIVKYSIAIWHPQTAAHLQFPVLIPSLGAELGLSALNASMDSFDQGPAATTVEEMSLKWLAQLIGLPETAAGTFSTGGTQSNYMGLLLARDHYLSTRHNWLALEKGLPPESGKLRILCSEIAHFSVEKTAIQLGLGTKAVVKIPVDAKYRMRTDVLEREIARLKAEGLEPFAVVATAGTTDFGSFDPVEMVGEIARAAGIWFHVDAAYGGAFLLSEKHRNKLKGIERADSVTMDFHKAFFQPISCGAFLVADAARFDLIRLYADYLNPESYEKDGIPNLVTRSLLTTRRFDALKLWMCMQSLGQKKFASMVDRLVELAEGIAKEIAASKSFELLHQPEFGCVVFRYCPSDASLNLAQTNKINDDIPRRMFEAGVAVIGHTLIVDRQCLKLTLNNPSVEPEQLTALLALIEQYGLAIERN